MVINKYMYKKSTFFVIIFSVCILAGTMVYAEEADQGIENKITEPLVESWNKEALPFLKGIATSFKTDVLDKASAWFEKAKAGKDSNSTFYDVLHNFFTGNESEKE